MSLPQSGLNMISDYHGNFLDTEFKDPNFLKKFKVFARRKSDKNPWTMHGVVVPEHEVEYVISDVQENLIPNAPYYAHLYRGNELIVIFKSKVFKITIDKSTWKEAIDYGRKLGIPDEQLVFEPHRIEDENKYYRAKMI